MNIHQYVEAFSMGQKMLFALGAFALTFIVSLAAVIAVLVRIPSGYFRESYVSPLASQHPAIRWTGMIVKNVLGALLIILGLLLSLPGVPGQGLLTILIGVMLLNFPGKRRLERWLISRPSVLAAVHSLRARFDKPPLLLE